MKFKLEDRMINEIVAKSLTEFLALAARSHHVDITLRINGENRNFEADWLKYLRLTKPHESQ